MFTLGSDPELFLQDTNGNLVSAIGKIGGTKEKPIEIRPLGKGFALQEDNVLLEYNTPPAKTFLEWDSSHEKILNFVDNFLKKWGLVKRISASEIMPDEQMENPAAWLFGCEPDYNAWTLEKNPRPECDEPLLRSAGGHVHVGVNLPDTKKILLVRWMDLYLGLYGVIHDSDTRRRQLYGKAGSFRYKPYGVEYRTLSNFWINSRAHRQWIWKHTQICVKHALGSVLIPEDVAQSCIIAVNESNKELASSLLKKYTGGVF